MTGRYLSEGYRNRVFRIEGNCINMLAVMERKGLVRREAVEHDARLKKLVLTEKARALVDRSEQDMRDMEALLAKGLSEGEIRV